MKNLAKDWRLLFTVCFILGLVGCSSEKRMTVQPEHGPWTIALESGKIHFIEFEGVRYKAEPGAGLIKTDEKLQQWIAN